MKCNDIELSERIKEHLGIIHKIAMLYTDSKADKEDLFQEICYQICKSYKSYRNKAQFSTWLYQVALNTAISQIRRNKKVSLTSLKDYMLDTREDETETRQSELLFKAIAMLEKIDKALILLWLESRSYDEIADIVGITKSNVSVKLVRIKRQISETIKKLEQ